MTPAYQRSRGGQFALAGAWFLGRIYVRPNVRRDLEPHLTRRILFPHPERMASLSPGLRGTSYPGCAMGWGLNPERVVSVVRRTVAIPVAWRRERTGRGGEATLTGLVGLSILEPRVARASQPWAESCNPFGISKTLRSFGRFMGRTLGVDKAVPLLAAAVIVLSPVHSQAAASAAFDLANKLYEEGKFAEAASAYEKLAQSGDTSAALCFNLGNAFFKSGRIGRAVAAYRTAEQITPRDPDLRANLQFARNQVQAPSLSPGRWQRWLGRLTLNEWTLLAAGVVWLWLLLLAVLQWRPALKPALRGYVLSLAILAGLFCACVAATLRETRFTRTAIVITGEAVVRYGPLAESPTAFTVHDGAELRVLDQKDEWLQISAGPRRVGWLRRDQTLVAGR